MSTPFSEKNKEFTEKAHLSARRYVYPELFRTIHGEYHRIDYENVTLIEGDERSKILDTEMAVDRKISVFAKGYNFPLTFTVQERFRKSRDFKKYQDITITEMNIYTHLPSELYKLSGGLFVYGYYDWYKDKIDQCVVFSSSSVLSYLVKKKLKFTVKHNPRTNQPFIAIRFNELRRNGLLLYDSNPPTKTVEQIIIETINSNYVCFGGFIKGDPTDIEIKHLVKSVRESNVGVISPNDEDSEDSIKDTIYFLSRNNKK